MGLRTKRQLVTFYKLNEGLADLFPPTPAIKDLPQWYKDAQSYSPKKIMKTPTSTSATVKKCVPVFDAMSSGYLLYTECDIQITQEGGSPYYMWSTGGETITMHSKAQASLYPTTWKSDFPKWMNPWGIKTPKGYSCLFTQPMHRESPFSVLPGIVDTDKYNNAVNIIFTLKDPKFEGVISAGTPIVQVIPFKRNSWNYKISKDKTEAKKTENLRNTYFFNAYRKLFWTPKEYNNKEK